MGSRNLGNAAIAMHLLGCMLARIWGMPEATSMLSEMVAARKAIVKRRTESAQFDISDIVAAEIVLSRDQLAAWDASARAWLRTADSAYPREHRQLMQLIEQSDWTLPTGNDVYAIVKRVWQNSINIAERLLAGQSYGTSTSEPLLALAAWHLYPNMAVLGPNTTDVLQEDPLFRTNGILTVGMPAAGSQSENGITWSLPLSHLRFYGKPVTKTRSLGLHSERIYFDDLKYVVLGTVTGHWFTKSGGLSKVTDFLNALLNCLQTIAPKASDELPEWLRLLGQAASEIRESQGQVRTNRERLYRFGQRRGSKFLSSSDSKVPEAFGLTSFGALIEQYGDHEAKIKKVRELLPTLISDTSLLQEGFISYKPHMKTRTLKPPSRNEHFHPTHADSLTSWPIAEEEYATIVPQPPLTRQHERRIPSLHAKESSSERGDFVSQLSTWEVSCMLSPASGQVQRCTDLSRATGELTGLYIQFAGYDSALHASSLKYGRTPEVELDSSYRAGRPVDHRFMRNPFSHQAPEILQTSNANWGEAVQAAQANRGLGDIKSCPTNPSMGFESDLVTEASFYPAFALPSSWRTVIRSWWNSADTSKLCPATEIGSHIRTSSATSYCLRLHDALDNGANISVQDTGCPQKYYIAESAQLGTRKYNLVAGDGSEFGVWFPTHSVYQLRGVPFNEIMIALDQHAEGKLLLSGLQEVWRTGDPNYWASLRAFTIATVIFRNFPETTISLSVTKQPLYKAKWFDESMLEPSLGDLEGVMAMSAGNSLFIADYIFSDPSDNPGTRVRHTVGNIGKPGVSFLLSAQGLDSLPPDYSTWKSVQYAAYDGGVENSFDHTTLHLTLTGDEQPLNIGQTGYHDKEVFLVEAVVRAYDKNRWVADLDLKLRPNPVIRAIPATDACVCAHDEHERSNYKGFEPLTSIDSWDELLDPPPNTGVVRTKANWLARQAVAAFAVQQSIPVIVTPEVICWGCVKGVLNQLSAAEAVKLSSNFLILC